MKGQNSIRGILKNILPFLRIAAFVLLTIAIARPQTTLSAEEINTEGIDIVFAIDVSTSMLARDFKPDRLKAAKQVAKEFIQKRPNDRIGLVIFAGESFTQCPITVDHNVLLSQLDDISAQYLQDGTAIGMGLATSVNRLVDSKSKSKVVILLTDGVSNSGFVDPYTASEAASQYNIRTYTVGIGSKGKAYMPVQNPYTGEEEYMLTDVQIDEPLMKKVAENTGGKYFRATNTDGLREVLTEIDQMEKTKIEITAYSRKKELFLSFAMSAFVLLCIEIFLRYTLLKSIP